MTVLEEELRTSSLKEKQQRHSLLAWQKVPDSASADQEITRLQAQVLLEKAKGEEVSKMLESTCITLRCASPGPTRQYGPVSVPKCHF